MLFPSSSELIIENTQEAATRIVQEHEVIRLSREEQNRFCQCFAGTVRAGHAYQQGRPELPTKNGALIGAFFGS